VYATDLAAGLRQLDVTCEVVALAPGTHGEKLDVEHLGNRRIAWATLKHLRQRAKTFDVVVAHGSSTLVACAIALAGTRVPFVYRQISDPLHWAGTLSRRIRVGLYLRRAAAVVSLSDGAASVLATHYRIGRDGIHIIPNAVPGDGFDAAPHAEIAETKASLGLDDAAPVAIYLGALVEEKGVDMAIRAAGASPGLHLLVVGDGPARPELELLAHEVAPERVHFTGSVSEPAALLRAADFLVLPSRAGDSMPAVVIEAGLCGLACITTPVGSITDVVVDQVTGLVVPIGDQPQLDAAVQSLLGDVALRDRLGHDARMRCLERFTIESTVPLWTAVFENL
jgi:glycosyltransferase involved in cell wall biosynthesis